MQISDRLQRLESLRSDVFTLKWIHFVKNNVIVSRKLNKALTEK